MTRRSLFSLLLVPFLPLSLLFKKQHYFTGRVVVSGYIQKPSGVAYQCVFVNGKAVKVERIS